MYLAILASLCVLLCIIPFIVLLAYFIIFMYESAIASVTTTYILCEMMANNSHVISHSCPKPWHYSNYLEAIEYMKTYATISFSLSLTLIVIAVILVCCFGGIGLNRNNNYTSI